VFSKACELFILELAYGGYANARTGNRKTIKANDLSSILKTFPKFDFLLDLIDSNMKDLFAKLFESFPCSEASTVSLLLTLGEDTKRSYLEQLH
jgi:hypothetical protein